MNPGSEQLHRVLLGCRQGHRDTQQSLYDLFYGFSLGICMRYATDEEDAMEVLQDGFLKVFQHLNEFVYPQDHDALFPAFRGWIKKIMVFTAIDHYRAQKKYHVIDQLESRNYKMVSGNHHPLDKLAYDELMKLVQHLSPAYRTVFNLFVIDGFTHDEVAQTLGISVGTSKSNLAKARENLRHMLKKRDETLYTKYE